MSRIGKSPVQIPSGVELKIEGSVVYVKGKLGELSRDISPITAEIKDNAVYFNRPSDSKADKSFHGLYRSLVNNMVIGVSEGFTISLELVGVGYRASNQGQVLDLSLGFSHNIVINVASEVKVETISEKGKNPIIKFTSNDKELVGKLAAEVRSYRPPEPYKGKGVLFVGEVLRKKDGKSA